MKEISQKKSYLKTGPRKGAGGRAFPAKENNMGKGGMCCGNDVEFSKGVGGELMGKGFDCQESRVRALQVTSSQQEHFKQGPGMRGLRQRFRSLPGNKKRNEMQF